MLGLLACHADRADDLESALKAARGANVLLIVVDTLRADWTGPYGSPETITPQLDRWAEAGIVFERVRAQSSWTKMSMASLMTSLWPRSHRIRLARDALAPAALTLAEVLKEAGYQTFGVQTNGWLHQSFGFHQGFDHYSFPIGRGAVGMPQSGIWSHADRVLQEARQILEDREAERPLFLYLHFMDVHQYASPTEFRKFGAGEIGQYKGAIHWVDDAIRRAGALLYEQGLLDSTLIVVASDHGETFGENGSWGHAKNSLTGALWVPLIVKLPRPIDALRVASQVRNLDLAPTLLDLLGLEVPDSFEGESLRSRIVAADRGGPPHEDLASFAALGQPLFPDASTQGSLNDGRWLYARDLDPTDARAEFLFDRAVDPVENVNLVGIETEAAKDLRARFESHRSHEPVIDVLKQDVRIDPGIADRLRAMGYIE